MPPARRAATCCVPLAVLLAAVLGVASCGSSSPSGFQLISASYTKTVGIQSARVAITTVLNEKGSGSALSSTITSSGVIDFATRAFDLTVNAPQGGPEEVRSTGGVLYVEVPAAARAQVPGNKPWVSVNLAALAQAATGQTLASL